MPAVGEQCLEKPRIKSMAMATHEVAVTSLSTSLCSVALLAGPAGDPEGPKGLLTYSHLPPGKGPQGRVCHRKS